MGAVKEKILKVTGKLPYGKGPAGREPYQFDGCHLRNVWTMAWMRICQCGGHQTVSSRKMLLINRGVKHMTVESIQKNIRFLHTPSTAMIGLPPEWILTGFWMRIRAGMEPLPPSDYKGLVGMVLGVRMS